MIIKLAEIKENPRYNEIGFFSRGGTNYDSTQPFSYAKLIDLVKKSPEVVGIIHAIQTDICSDGIRFMGAKQNVAKAEEFVKTNRFKSQLSAAILDWLMLGNFAIWKGKLSESSLKEVISKMQVAMGVEIKETEIKQMIDEDTLRTKLLLHIAWSTVHIDLNEEKSVVTGFRQITGDMLQPNHFSPEEIIHGKFMDFDGKVYGMSPLETSINVVSTLSLIKDLNGAFFDNGGIPDWMFILPKEYAGSANVKKLQQSLRTFQSSRRKHGSLVFTGEINPVPLNKFDKDMEYRLMAIYYTGIVALAFNMPMARVAAIIGAEVKAGAASTDLSEAGYWRGISNKQDYLEDLFNYQLWMPEFKVEMKFNRGYKNDEIKEAQRDVQLFEVLNKLFLSKAVTAEYIKDKLHIPNQYWTGKFEPVQPQGFGGGSNFGSPGSPPKETEKGDARKEFAERKKVEAEKNT